MHVAKMKASEHRSIKFPIWVLNMVSKQRIKMEARKSFTTASSQADEHDSRSAGWTKAGYLPARAEQHGPTPCGQLTPKGMKGQRETKREFWKKLPHRNQAQEKVIPF